MRLWWIGGLSLAWVMSVGCGGAPSTRTPREPVRVEVSSGNDRAAPREDAQPEGGEAEAAGEAPAPTAERTERIEQAEQSEETGGTATLEAAADASDSIETQADVGEAPPLDDRHPFLVAYADALARWLTGDEEAALRGLSLSGTIHGVEESMTRRVRYTFFRELGGRALGSVRSRELRRFAHDVRGLPPTRRMDLGAAEAAHMNLDAYFHVLGDLVTECAYAGDAEVSEERGEERRLRCEQRFERSSAAGRLAFQTFRDMDPATARYVGGGTMLGGGEAIQDASKPLEVVLDIAVEAGLSRAYVRRVALRVLREMVDDARAQS